MNLLNLRSSHATASITFKNESSAEIFKSHLDNMLSDFYANEPWCDGAEIKTNPVTGRSTVFLEGWKQETFKGHEKFGSISSSFGSTVQHLTLAEEQQLSEQHRILGLGRRNDD
jgi:hypothetical protein